MTDKAPSQAPRALSFYNSELEPAWKAAALYAGMGGRIATLPDIIAARLTSSAEDVMEDRHESHAWSTYSTTTSAEYVGISRGGVAIVVVAHGIGPLTTLDRLVEGYKKDRRYPDERVEGVRIPREEFLALESGAYGPVNVIPLIDVLERHQYPFIGAITTKQTLREPLMRARLGPSAEAYIELHEKANQLFASKKGCVSGKNQKILGMGGAYSLYCRDDDNTLLLHKLPGIGGKAPTEAFGHLLSIGQVVTSHFSHRDQEHPSLTSDISLHDRGDGVRFIAIPEGADPLKILPGPNARRLYAKHWRELIKPCRAGKQPPLYAIRYLGEDAFTEIPHEGHEMASGEAQYHVRSMQALGTGTFRTKVTGYYGFLRYDLKSVQEVAPEGANAFVRGEARVVDGGDYQECPVTFYKADIDTSQAMPKFERFEQNIDALLALHLRGY